MRIVGKTIQKAAILFVAVELVNDGTRVEIMV